MNVLFIYPNIRQACSIQVGIASLSAFIKREGHQTDLFDTTFYDFRNDYALIVNDLRTKIEDFNPDLVAISCRTTEYPFVLKLLGSIKNLTIPNVLGGPHPTVAPDEVISESLVDMVCIGEGEGALSELLYKMAHKEDITTIRNIWVKRDGQIFRNDVRPLIQNLDSLPLPDWDIFDERHPTYYFVDHKECRRGTFEMSRGCPYSCTYCINQFIQNIYKGKGKYYREKSVERVIEEINHYKNKYNLDIVYFVDESFLNKRIETIKTFSVMYRKRVGLPFTLMTRPEVVTKEKATLIKDAGCCLISIGIESGNETYRREILNRKMSQEQIINAFKIAKEVGLRTYSFNMVGLPYENRKMVFDTVNLNRKIKPDHIQTTIFYPFPGTKLRDICIKEGFIHQESNERELTGYYEESILSMPELSKNQIEGLSRTFLLYYESPQIFYPMIRFLERNSYLSNTFFKIYNKFRIYRWTLFEPIYRRLVKKLKNQNIK